MNGSIWRTGLGVANSLSAKLGTALLQLLLHVMLAKYMTLEAYGTFVFALTVSMLTARLVPLGWPMLFLRLIPEAIEKARPADVWGVILVGLGTTVALGAIASLSLLAVARFGGIAPEYIRSLELAAALTPVVAMFGLINRGLQAFQRITLSVWPQGVVAPAVVCAIIWTHDNFTFGFVSTIYLGVLATALATSLVAFAAIAVSQTGLCRARLRVREWTSKAMSTAFGNVGIFALERADQLLVGMLLSVEAAGVYSLVSKLARVMLIPLQATNAVFPALMSRAFHRDEPHEAARWFRMSLLVAAAMSAPVFIGYQFFPQHLLAYFGQAFQAAQPALQILAIGFFIASATGDTSLSLVVIHRERLFGRISLAGATLCVLLNLALIPRFGIVGAAIGTCLAVVLVNLTQLIIVWRKLPRGSTQAARPGIDEGSGVGGAPRDRPAR